MKKTRFYLGGGALVLALALVMGCAQEAPTTDDTIGKETTKGWLIENQKNSSEQYWRWMRGTGKKYENALVGLDMSNAKAGKIGFIFGLSESLAADGKGNGKYSYYQFGIGVGKAGTPNAGQIEYYVDYYKDVDLSKVTGGSSSYGPEGVTPTEVVPLTRYQTSLDGNKLKVFVAMTCNKRNGYELKVGPTQTTATTLVGGKYLTEGAKDSKNEYMYSDIGYYAMLTQASATEPVTSTFEYTIESSKTSVIAAAEEE